MTAWPCLSTRRIGLAASLCVLLLGLPLDAADGGTKPPPDKATTSPGPDEAAGVTEPEPPSKTKQAAPKAADARPESGSSATPATPAPDDAAPETEPRPTERRPTRPRPRPEAAPRRPPKAPPQKTKVQAGSAKNHKSASPTDKGTQPSQSTEPASSQTNKAQQSSAQVLMSEPHRQLAHDVQRLRRARDASSLMLLCDSRRAQQVWDERALYLTWQALCRGHVYLIRDEWSAARNSYEKVFHQVNALPAQWRRLARQLAARAQFAVGSSYRDELLEAGTCLARLGSKELASFEAGRRANLRAAALQAFRDVARYDREAMFLSALLEINLLSDRLYRETTRPSMSWRALQPPPPLRDRGVPRTPLIRSILGPEHSSLRREVLLTYRKLVRRARRLSKDDPLRQRIEESRQSFEDYQPKVEEPVVVSWPERPLRQKNLLHLVRDKNEFVVITREGTERWDTERALTELRGILASAPEGRWAPRAVVELAELGDSSLMPTLVELLGHDQDPELQIAAVYAIGRIGDASTIGALLDAFARARARSDRELFTSASDAMYGLEENLLRSLAALGTREPRLFEGLLDDRRLPRRDAAYVLWRASAKRLYGLYVRMREDRDPWVKAYGLMALVELQGDTTRWMLAPQSSDDDLLRCVRSQLRYTLEAKP